MRVDVHQHFWSEPFVSALERRDALPLGRRDGAGRLRLRCAREVVSVIDLAHEHPRARASLLERDGVDRALIALSSPLGIEALPRAQSQALIDAHLEGVAGLGERFSPWGPVALDGLCAEDVDAVLGRGAIGVSMPAGALDSERSVAALGPALERLEELGAPLFVHPGPGLGGAGAEAPATEPRWWSALTAYVHDMQCAWLAFAAFARPAHPRLRVVFAMLAGNAPLLGERLEARGGPAVDLADPFAFYETSSFGEAAIGALAVVVGDGRLLYGSDRPVVEPDPGGRGRVHAANGEWLLEPRSAGGAPPV